MSDFSSGERNGLKSGVQPISTRSRRRFLQGAGVTASVALAGCDIPFAGSVTLPPLTDGWAAVRRDGRVALILRFDGDIRGLMDKYSISKSDIFAGLEENGYPVTDRSVSIRGTETVPGEETVSAVIDNLIEPDRMWPGGTRFQAGDGFFLQKTLRLEGERSVQIPISDASFVIQFPSGYRYVLPVMDQEVTNIYKVSLDREHSGLFDYGGYSKSRTIPVISHHDPSIAARAHAFDAYRAYVFEQFETLTDISKYGEQFYSEFSQSVTNLGFDIGWEGAQQFNPLSLGFFPETLSGLLSIHSALETHRQDLMSALDSLEKWNGAVMNDDWMRPLHTDLGKLRMNAEVGFWGINPAWVSAPSKSFSKARIRDYISLLESQHARVKKYASGEFREDKTVYGVESTYFSGLFDTVVTTLAETYNPLNDALTELRTIESAL